MSFDRRLIVLAALVAAPVVVVSCSLPPDDRPTRLNADDLGPELVNPTTTTTTTVAPSTVPPSTEPGATRPTQPPTTEPGFATAPQQLVYTLGSSEVVQQISVELPERVSFAGIRNELEVPKPEVRGLGLASAVRPGLIAGFAFDEDTVTLTVDLDDSIFTGLTESQRRRAIGQIVLTFTQFTQPDRGAVGFVVFTVDGSPTSVFVPRTGGSSDEGQPLTFADFRPMLDDGTPVDTEPPTSPPTTAPPTSAPATTAAP